MRSEYQAQQATFARTRTREGAVLNGLRVRTDVELRIEVGHNGTSVWRPQLPLGAYRGSANFTATCRPCRLHPAQANGCCLECHLRRRLKVVMPADEVGE